MDCFVFKTVIIKYLKHIVQKILYNQYIIKECFSWILCIPVQTEVVHLKYPSLCFCPLYFLEGIVVIMCVYSCAIGSQREVLHTGQEVLQQSTAVPQGKLAAQAEPVSSMGSTRYIVLHLICLYLSNGKHISFRIL
jgi:hypothetical protein